MKIQRKNQQGFSLIELLIVVAIMLVIAAVAIPAAIASSQAGNETSAANNMRALVTASTAYEKLFPNIGYPALAANLDMGGTSGGASACPNSPDPTGKGACLLANNIADAMDAGTTAISGYLMTYKVATGNGGYAMTAVPATSIKGRKSFCVDSSGSIVFAWGVVAPVPVAGVCPAPTATGPFALGS